MTATAAEAAALKKLLTDMHLAALEEVLKRQLGGRPQRPPSRIRAFFNRIFRSRPMDLATISTVIDTAADRITRAVGELQAATATAAELDTTKASLAASQADIAAAQSTIADLTTKLSTASDALASVLPAPTSAAAASAA